MEEDIITGFNYFGKVTLGKKEGEFQFSILEDAIDFYHDNEIEYIY